MTVTVLGLSSMLGGCAGLAELAPEAAGLGAGAGAGVLTANPLIGVAVGIGARLAAAEALDYAKDERKRRIYGAIARAAGQSETSAAVPWASRPDTLFDTVFGQASGYVQVVRAFGGRIPCKEIIYTLEEGTDVAEGEASSPNSGDAGDARAVPREGSEDSALTAAPAPSPASSPATPPANDGDDDGWPEAIIAPIATAVVCEGPLGWQWAAGPAAPSR